MSTIVGEIHASNTLNPIMGMTVQTLGHLKKLMDFANERRLTFTARSVEYGFQFEIEAPPYIGTAEDILSAALHEASAKHFEVLDD